MFLKNIFSAFLLLSAMVVTPLSYADGPSDSSSDASRGFLSDVQASKALVLRVPINERGEENTSMASMRLYQGDEDLSQGADIVTAWDESKSIDDQPTVSGDAPTDGSTWGWYGYRGRGWARPYYYSGYTPYAYYYGSSYYYRTPSYYSYYSPYYGSYGYRYYYYGYY